MPLTVVGTNTVTDSSSSAHALTIALPAGTIVGDWIILSWVTFDASFSTSDTRLSTIGSGANVYAAHGEATTLADVTVTTGGYQIFTVVTVRGFGAGPLVGATPVDPLSSTVWPSGLGLGPSVAFVADRGISGSTITDVAVGTATGWTSDAYTTASFDSSKNLAALRLFSFTGVGEAPGLSASYGADTTTRKSALFFLTPEAAPASRYLRQRQSPHASPSRQSYPTLRQRQTFIR